MPWHVVPCLVTNGSHGLIPLTHDNTFPVPPVLSCSAAATGVLIRQQKERDRVRDRIRDRVRDVVRGRVALICIATTQC